MPYLNQLNYNQEAAKVYLNDVYNSVVLKDIISRNQIRYVDLLQRLVKYILINNGKVFQPARWKNILNLQAERFLWILFLTIFLIAKKLFQRILLKAGI